MAVAFHDDAGGGAGGGAVARIVGASAARPRRVAAIGLLLTLLSLFYAERHFAVSADTLALIAPDVGWRQDERALYRAFPLTGETMLAVVDGATPELAEAGAAQLAAAIAGDRANAHAVSRPDGGPFFDVNGLMLGSRDAVERAAAGLIEGQPLLGPLAADPSMRGIAGAFATLAEGAARTGTSLDRLAGPMERLAAGLERGGPFSWATLLAGDGPAPPTRRLVLVQPRLDYAALKPGAAAEAAVRGHATRLGLTPDNGVTVRLTGPAPLAAEEMDSLEHNAGLVGAVMAGAMLMTLWFATRSLRLVAAILVVTGAGLVIAGALGLAAVGRFNIVSVAFVPLFVGLGIDFSIQLASAFQAARGAPGDVPGALARAGGAIGPSLLLAAAAVTLGFCAFLPTAYVGVAELGIVAAIGMVVALVLTVTLLPALIVLLRGGRVRATRGWAGAAPIDRWLARRRGAVLAAFGVALLLSAASLFWVRFDFNPIHLRDPAREAMATLADLARDPDRSPDVVQLVARDLGAARVLAARLRALPEVRRVVSVDSFVPAEQAAKLAAIDDARALLDYTLDPVAVAPPATDAETRAALDDAARRLRAAANGPSAGEGEGARTARRLAAAFSALAQDTPQRRAGAGRALSVPLAQTLATIRAALSAAPLTIASLPPALRAEWIAPDGRARLAVLPAGAGDNATLERFVAAVRSVAPAATGAPVAIQEAARTIAGAFVQAGLIALVAVSLLLYAVLRNVREVLFTLAPVALSIFLTLGTCVVIGQPINFANIIAFPLLFGVGVAFHIYFVMAWRGGASDLLQSSLARAIFFSALATGTAFGSVWLSGHPGTASMGKVLMLSLVWTLVCALIFEPALLGPANRSPSGRVRPAVS